MKYWEEKQKISRLYETKSILFSRILQIEAEIK